MSRIVVLAFSFLIFVSGARAEDATGPRIGRGDVWLVIGQTESDSTCLGDLSTPTCAMETFLACFTRERSDWCSAVMGAPYDFGSGKAPPRYRLYRIEKIEELPRGQLFGDVHAITPTQDGDVVVVVSIRDCWFGPGEPENEDCRPPETRHYLFRGKDAHWIVVNANSED